jgi:hypothetical protein
MPPVPGRPDRQHHEALRQGNPAIVAPATEGAAVVLHPLDQAPGHPHRDAPAGQELDGGDRGPMGTRPPGEGVVSFRVQVVQADVHRQEGDPGEAFQAFPLPPPGGLHQGREPHPPAGLGHLQEVRVETGIPAGQHDADHLALPGLPEEADPLPAGTFRTGVGARSQEAVRAGQGTSPGEVQVQQEQAAPVPVDRLHRPEGLPVPARLVGGHGASRVPWTTPQASSTRGQGE